MKMQAENIWWSYLYFHLPNYALALLFWTLIGRFMFSLGHGLLDRVRHLEQREVLRADQAPSEQVRVDVFLPVAPVAAAGRVHEHHRQHLALAGLDQRERLEALVVRAEAAREQRDRVRVLDEGELAAEEVPEVDELRVAGGWAGRDNAALPEPT